MRSRLPFATVALPLFAALVLAATAVRAERLEARLQVSAEVAIRCQLDAGVPPVGSPGRNNASATVSVRCTKGAAVAADTCPVARGCEPLPPRADSPRYEWQHEPVAAGTSLATLLF
jgi:hypothetical protein